MIETTTVYVNTAIIIVLGMILLFSKKFFILIFSIVILEQILCFPLIMNIFQ